MGKQNLTVRLEGEIIRKAKVLAAQRGSSISRLIAETIDEMVGRAESYETARRGALELLDRGFHMGKSPRVSRDELHGRR